jgi:ABC-type nitrate/sulfonate/bicarbonate transport system permease component
LLIGLMGLLSTLVVDRYTKRLMPWRVTKKQNS